ncbi:MAG: DUF3727 domain-containing protein [Synechococcales cyanobacterium RM1_1_8]|nr:DUF3727 domain-containing protein [Synechococcales cyanobacterium RM1_1_8]
MADVPTVWLEDDNGRSLFCHLEYSLDLDGKTYGLLQPVDAPVMIFAWGEDDDEPTILEDDEELQPLLPTARAVLSEQNLTLLETAVTWTVEGDLPELEEDEDEAERNGGAAGSGPSAANGLPHRRDGSLEPEDLEPEDLDDDEDMEFDEYQLLAHFFHDDCEYEIYTPIKPPFAFWTLLEDGKPKLLSLEAMEAVEPLLNEAVSQEFDLSGEG